MTLTVSRRASVSIVCAAVMLGPTPRAAYAQRLLARQDAIVYDLAAGGFLGDVAGPYSLAGCPAGFFAGPPRTWTTDGGRFVAWDREDGACLYDAASGAIRSLDLPAYVTLVAARREGFGLVAAEHAIPGSPTRTSERLHLLTSPAGEWRIVTLTELLPPPAAFASRYWSYDIAEDTGDVMVVESRDFANRTSPILTRVAAGSGTIASVTRVDGLLFPSAMATSRDGTRVVLLCDDSYERRYGVFLVNSATGVHVAANTDITPFVLGNRYPNGVAAWFHDSVAWDEPAGRLLVIAYERNTPSTPQSTLLLDATTLSVVATLDAPRQRLPVPPEYRAELGATLLLDRATHTAYLVERELLSARLSNDWSLRAVVYALDTRTLSVLRSVDFAPAYGLGAARLAELAFVVPAPAAPGEPVARVTGGRVTISWAASPGATFYSVEAAVTPGGPTIVSVPVASPSLAVPAAPPGRYFVRVRAVGIGGAGPRSAEIVVDVP